MKLNGFSTFLYRIAKFHLVMHFVMRLRKAPIGIQEALHIQCEIRFVASYIVQIRCASDIVV
jgi:hypothetical protein